PFDSDAVRARLTTSPAPEAEVHVLKSALMRRAGRFAEADSEVEKAKAIDPKCPMIDEAITGHESAKEPKKQFEDDSTEVMRLAKEGRFHLATAIVGRMESQSEFAADPKAIKFLRDFIYDYEVRAQALHFFQTKQWRELQDLAKDYLANHSDGGFANSARQLI